MTDFHKTLENSSPVDKLTGNNRLDIAADPKTGSSGLRFHEHSRIHWICPTDIGIVRLFCQNLKILLTLERPLAAALGV